jgi:hypothetical protein
MPNRAVVQSAGHAYRLRGHLFKQEIKRCWDLQRLLLRYTSALLTQMGQTAVCNRHHSVDQQLCRWLLLSLDRLATNELAMTQELIANMLGVRREGVTVSFRQGCVNSEQQSSNVGAPRTWRAGCSAGAGAGSVLERRPAGGGQGAVAWVGAGGSGDAAGRGRNQSGSVASAARRARVAV